MRRGYKPWLIYGGLALIIMLPLLAPGYILTLDMVFAPHQPLPAEVGSSYLFHAAIHYLSYVIPADILQKIILLSIFLFSGIGAHRLAAHRLKAEAESGRVAAYAAGVIYVINPFVYARFMAGQYAVLLGYMLLPFFARAALNFMKNPGWKEALKAAALLLGISIVSIHTVGLTAVFLVVLAATHQWSRRDHRYIKQLLTRGAACAALVVVLSAYWIIPALQGRGIAEQISSFSDVDRAAFATDGGLWSVLQLKGFWAEAQDLFIHVDDPLPLSGLAQALMWTVIGIGVAYAWRRQRRGAILWSITAILAVILALGTHFSYWLAEHVPFFAGYREPHKFAALLALSYAVFAAYGVAAIARRIEQWQLRKYGLAAVGVLLPFWVTPAMLWGFNGQLKPSHYPADWYAVNNQLNQDSEDYSVLFLPWHLYMRFSFTGRIIAQPTEKFFDKPIITSQNPEFADLRPVYRDAAVRDLDMRILPAAKHAFHLGEELAPHGIKYILLAKEADYQAYDYLDSQSDLELIKEMDHLKVYLNKAFGREGQP